MSTFAVAFSSSVPEAISLRQQGEQFWVELPRSADAKGIRAALLMQYFGYAQEDIDALVRATGFKIADVGTPDVEATAEQIESWRRDAAGRVPIRLSDYWVERLRSFRIERVRALVAQAATGIQDPAMRAAWSQMMLAVLTGSSEERGRTFIELMNAIHGSGQPRGQYVAALESLHPTSVGGNPYIDLALATLALEDAKTLIGPGYDTLVRSRLADAMRKLEMSELRDGGIGLTRADAEVANRQAARIHAELGDEDASNRRQWIARFMGMSDDERAQYEEGDVVELAEPGAKTVSAPNTTSRRLDQLEQDWQERQRMERTLNGIGAQSPPNFPNDDALFNQGTESITIDGVVLRKKRGTDRKYQPRFRVSTVTVPLRNPTAVTNMKGGLAAIELFNTAGKYLAADRRSRELAEYQASKDALQGRLRNQRYRLVPPKPAKVKAELDRLVAIDRGTSDPRNKEQLQSAISALRALLEESRAAWPDP
jgi:hypothetical protein